MDKGEFQAGEGEKERKTVTVSVNGEPVAFSVRKANGLQIKETAINQGVKIKPDFTLFKLREEEGPPKQIGDAEEVELKEGERFRAVTPDDKS